MTTQYVSEEQATDAMCLYQHFIARGGLRTWYVDNWRLGAYVFRERLLSLAEYTTDAYELVMGHIPGEMAFDLEFCKEFLSVYIDLHDDFEDIDFFKVKQVTVQLIHNNDGEIEDAA